MTNRYRAGQPADLSQSSPSECASSGCNWPEGDCLGLCTLPSLEKVNATPIQWPYIQLRDIAGDEPVKCPVATFETPLRARIMDACADALDYVLDRLWVGAVGLVVAVCLLVWSLK